MALVLYYAAEGVVLQPFFCAKKRGGGGIWNYSILLRYPATKNLLLLRRICDIFRGNILTFLWFMFSLSVVEFLLLLIRFRRRLRRDLRQDNRTLNLE